MWMSAAMVALFLCVPPEVAGSFLDAHNCEFICCLSQALQPLPTCVPPEESRLQKWGRVVCTNSFCLVGIAKYENDYPPPGEQFVRSKFSYHKNLKPNPCRSFRHWKHPDVLRPEGWDDIKKNGAPHPKSKHSTRRGKRARRSINSVGANPRNLTKRAVDDAAKKKERAEKWNWIFADDTYCEDEEYCLNIQGTQIVETRLRIISIDHIDNTHLLASLTVELVWTDTQLALCDCRPENFSVSARASFPPDDVLSWIWLPSFNNFDDQGWDQRGIDIHERTEIIELTPEKLGVTISLTSDVQMATPCIRNKTWWPYEEIHCYMALGSYQFAFPTAAYYLSDLETFGIPSETGGYKIEIYPMTPYDGLFVDEYEMWTFVGFKVQAQRVWHLTENFLDHLYTSFSTLLIVSYGMLAFPTTSFDRQAVLAGFMIMGMYQCQWWMTNLPDVVGTHITNFIIRQTVIISIPVWQTMVTHLLLTSILTHTCITFVDIITMLFGLSWYFFDYGWELKYLKDETEINKCAQLYTVRASEELYSNPSLLPFQ